MYKIFFIFFILINLSYAQELSVKRKAELKHLLIHDCGSCHGMTMKGGLGTALLPENLKAKPPSYLKAVILNGLPGKAMPAWKEILTEVEVDWIVQMLMQGVRQDEAKNNE